MNEVKKAKLFVLIEINFLGEMLYDLFKKFNI